MKKRNRYSSTTKKRNNPETKKKFAEASPRRLARDGIADDECQRLPMETTTDEIICYCKGVKRSTIVEAIRAGARTIKDIQKATQAATGTQCKELNPKGICCAGDVRNILREELSIDDKTPCCTQDCCTED